ncbi:hypothetical protein CVT25_011828 [Psilocybe cyanescens]|uniref:Uncharacterized protein n=1 Tax=Psilocybe cyanescens TaxID=93625 RepID=A0A409WJ04_PSICY|nr:hypothetical protein CVT25_011828 [Psilocybe cyanescens]
MIRSWRAWSNPYRTAITTSSLLRPPAQCRRPAAPPPSLLLHPNGQRFFASISTLNHELIAYINQPIANISGLNCARLYIYLTPTSIRHAKIFYCEDLKTPFPDGTRGYFYYLQDPRFPLVDGAVRFRVLPEDKIEFDAEGGEDLRTPDGKVWERTLYFIHRRKDTSLLEKLILEKLVHADAKEVHRAYVTEHNRKQEARQPREGWNWSVDSRMALENCRLFSKDDMFELDLSRACHYFHIGDPDSDSDIDTKLDLWYIFRDRRSMHKLESSHGLAPYQGKITARFELTSLLDSKRKLRTYIVIRVLEITEPITPTPLVEKYDGYVHAPALGQLLGRGLHSGEGEAIAGNAAMLWKLPLDSPRGTKLQPLFTEMGMEMKVQEVTWQ